MKSKRGRKPLEKTDLHARVAPPTPTALREKAEKLGFKYGNSGATGEMLDAIAQGRLIVIPQETWENLEKLVTTFRGIKLE